MRRKLPKILVTGAAGFIGSEFVRQLLRGKESPRYQVIIVDKLTYAADLKRLSEVKGKFKFYQTDICNGKKIAEIFKKEKPEIVVNFSAETHVDRSIIDSSPFLETNINGTKNLLDESRKYNVARLIHISTDEIYGDIIKGSFTESSAYKPNSPYAASKAAADLLVGAYIRTYKFPALIVRPSNNYGPWQYPEKFVPVIIYKALKNEAIPVYGRGQNVREWLNVQDCASAILTIIARGKIGEIYNVGSGDEYKNIDIAKNILHILAKPLSLISYVEDRPGHDFRYSLDFSKIKRELGWQPRVNFEQGLVETVHWYKENLPWLEQKVKYLRDYWKKVYK